MIELIFWAVLFVVMVLLELLTLGLTSLWFAAGAIAAIFAQFLGAPFVIQAIVFLVVSVDLLYLLAPWARRYFNKERMKTNAQSLIGKQAVITEPINNLQSRGRVIVDGMEWSARYSGDSGCAPEGTVVRIKDIQGVKLIVEDVQEKE